jgi:hypothetical protein
VGLSYAFESLFLTGWILFAAWPWFRRATPLRWAVHWSLWPLLLFLPYFLGYAPFAFTFGPSGGFVYPGVLLLFSVPVMWFPGTAIDVAILRALPRPLWALSQMTGPAMAMSSMAFIGPIGLTLYGVTVGCVVFGTRCFVERRARKKTRESREPNRGHAHDAQKDARV